MNLAFNRPVGSFTQNDWPFCTAFHELSSSAGEAGMWQIEWRPAASFDPTDFCTSKPESVVASPDVHDWNGFFHFQRKL